MKINPNVNRFVDDCVHVSTFAMIGNLSGRIVNHIDKLLAPSLFEKAPLINLGTATAFCAVFITIDQIASKIIAKFSSHNCHVLTMRLIALSFSFGSTFPLQYPLVKCFGLTALNPKAMAITMWTAIFLHSFVIKTILSWNEVDRHPHHGKNVSWER